MRADSLTWTALAAWNPMKSLRLCLKCCLSKGLMPVLQLIRMPKITEAASHAWQQALQGTSRCLKMEMSSVRRHSYQFCMAVLQRRVDMSRLSWGAGPRSLETSSVLSVTPWPLGLQLLQEARIA